MKRKSVILLFVFSGAYAHWGNSVEMEAIKICVTSKNYITDICQTLTFPALWNNYCSKHVISSSDINKEKKMHLFDRILVFHYFSQSKNNNATSLLFCKLLFITLWQVHLFQRCLPSNTKRFFSNHIIKSCQLLNYLI